MVIFLGPRPNSYRHRTLDEEERQVSRTIEGHKKEGVVITKTGMRMKLVSSAVDAHVGACELRNHYQTSNGTHLNLGLKFRYLSKRRRPRVMSVSCKALQEILTHSKGFN